MSKKSKKLSVNSNGNNISLELKTLYPLTKNQRIAFEAGSNNSLILYGSPGTGKTLISFYLACKDLLYSSQYKKIVIVRSAVPSRNQGFLPGGIKEKSKAYELPYYGICSFLFGRGDAYDILKNKGMIEFISTSYIRGITISDCVIILEECQNLEWSELYTTITRTGENSRIIITGDYKQSDLNKNKADILKFMDVVKKLDCFKFIQFTTDDICRSKLVKDFIIECEKQGL